MKKSLEELQAASEDWNTAKFGFGKGDIIESGNNRGVFAGWPVESFRASSMRIFKKNGELSQVSRLIYHPEKVKLLQKAETMPVDDDNSPSPL